MTISQYIINEEDLEAKYLKICGIQDALLDAMTNAALNQDIQHYQLDDGQTRLSTTYRSVSDMQKSYWDLDKVKNTISQRLGGTRIIRLMDAKAVQSAGLYSFAFVSR